MRAPVLIGVEDMSLKVVSEASATAMEDESPYMAGTMTVQNLGAFGLSSAAPVVHTPQACCLALGAVVDAAALVDGKVVSQPKLAATLFFVEPDDAALHASLDFNIPAKWAPKPAKKRRKKATKPPAKVSSKKAASASRTAMRTYDSV